MCNASCPQEVGSSETQLRAAWRRLDMRAAAVQDREIIEYTAALIDKADAL